MPVDLLLSRPFCSEGPEEADSVESLLRASWYLMASTREDQGDALHLENHEGLGFVTMGYGQP
jgi:hypothetical protein